MSLAGLDNWITRIDDSMFGIEEPEDARADAIAYLDALMQEGKSDPVVWLLVEAGDMPEAREVRRLAKRMAEYLRACDPH